MCKECGCNCQNPDELVASPQECTAEQIESCHGTSNNHPYVKHLQKKKVGNSNESSGNINGSIPGFER